MTLEEKLDQLHQHLDTPYNPDDIESIKHKLDKLNNLGGFAALCKADAREELERKKLEALMDIEADEKQRKLPPTIKMQLVNGMASYELRNYEYADRLNAGLSHCIEGIRSRLSLYKSELENSLHEVNTTSRQLLAS